jgi:Carboxypeptidase regulatory-like domain
MQSTPIGGHSAASVLCSFNSLRGLSLLTLLLISAPFALAQGRAGISGRVADQSGAAVSGAKVELINPATNESREVVTDAEGTYQLFPLGPGRYRLEVQADGFKKYSQVNLTLQVDERLTVDAALEVGGVQETVSVTDQPSIINTQDATVRGVVDAKRMADLPLNGRSPLQLMLLGPGVLPSPGTGIGGSFQPGGQQFVASSGSKANGINYVLDGGDNMDTYRSVANSFPNPDILQEFSFQTNSYSAEFGGRAGGVVNAVTKSGTNDLHGTAYEFARNSALNARNFFAPIVNGKAVDDGLKRHQFGGTIGGPVYLPRFGEGGRAVYRGRDKTFFFFGMQMTTVRQTPANLTATVLTAEQRRGDFSNFRTAQGALIPIRDPLTNQPFPGNIIPTARLDPIFQNLLKFVPTATDPTGLIRYSSKTINDALQYNVRVDHNFSANDRFSARFFKDNFEQPGVGDPNNILTYANRLTQRATNVVLAYNKVFSPRFFGEFLFAFNRSAGLRGESTPTTWRELGSNVIPAGNSRDLVLQFPGFFNIVLFGDTPLARNNFQYKPTFSYQLNNHNLRFGANIVRRQFNIPTVNVQFNGNFGFNDAVTGRNITDALIGRASTFNQDTGFKVALRQTDWSGFVQDEWKLNRRVTLSLGLRYEPFTPWTDRWNELPQTAQFIAGRQSSVYPNAPKGLLFYGDEGVPRGIAKSALNHWAPRVGVAIDPFGDGKSSIRAGYGLFWDALIPTEQAQQYASQLPVFTASTAILRPQSLANPYGDTTHSFLVPLPRARDYVFPIPVNTAVRFNAPGYTSAYTQQWNLTLERQLLKDTVVRVTYQGSQANRLPIAFEANPATYTAGSSTRANIQQRRPFNPDYASILVVDSFGKSWYHGLVVSGERRFTSDLAVTVSYTFSRNIDTGITVNSANTASANNPYNPLNDKGLADADRPHAFVASYVWNLPRFQSAPAVIRYLLGGWQHNGIIALYSGTPFSVVSGIDNSLTGVNQDRADLIGDPNLDAGRSKGDKIIRYFNTAAFALNPEGTFGTAGRNILRAPGSVNIDMSIFKNIPLWEQHTFQLRGEFFNVPNRTNLGGPNANFSSSTFGRITSAGFPRVIQIALKYIF